MGKRSFTIIELMVIVIIMSFLASMAIPNFNRTMRKARKKQAMAMLELIYQAQILYGRIDYKEYFKHPTNPRRFSGDDGFQGLELHIDDPNARSSHYVYTIDSVTENPNTFQARARYPRDNTTLMIDQTGTITEE